VKYGTDLDVIVAIHPLRLSTANRQNDEIAVKLLFDKRCVEFSKLFSVWRRWYNKQLNTSLFLYFEGTMKTRHSVDVCRL